MPEPKAQLSHRYSKDKLLTSTSNANISAQINHPNSGAKVAVGQLIKSKTSQCKQKHQFKKNNLLLLQMGQIIQDLQAEKLIILKQIVRTIAVKILNRQARQPGTLEQSQTLLEILLITTNQLRVLMRCLRRRKMISSRIHPPKYVKGVLF